MRNIIMSIITNTDSYKVGQYRQIPPGTEYTSSYIESRGGKWDKTQFIGLQMFSQEYLSMPITKYDIDEASEIFHLHLPEMSDGSVFNHAGWKHILGKHGGYLPLAINAVPEGIVLPGRNVLVQITNTDPAVPWLTTYVETSILRAIWYPTTIATSDWHVKQVIRKYLETTSDENIENDLLFSLHDFGSRGVSSKESAGIGGIAHLINFRGTDNLEALLYGRKYYDSKMPGFSIHASEHSTVTIWGGPDKEIDAMRNMHNVFGGNGSTFAFVSDSYDIFEACKKWGAMNKEIQASGSKLVIRPDSGKPVERVVLNVVNALMHEFGWIANKKGYAELPPHVSVIQGDGINPAMIEKILFTLKDNRISTNTVSFGMGGGLLQDVNRDDLQFAMKMSAAKVDGKWRDVYKNPIGDPNKASKKGRLELIYSNGEYDTIRVEDEHTKTSMRMLQPAYLNGEILRSQTLDEIRALGDDV